MIVLTATATVKMLARSDAVAYLESLLAVREEISMDAHAILAAHATLSTASSKPEGEKKARCVDAPHRSSADRFRSTLRQRVSTFLSARILVWPSIAARNVLIRCIERAADPSRLYTLLPLLKQLGKPAALKTLESTPVETVDAYLELLCRLFDERSKTLLDDRDGAFGAFKHLVELDQPSRASCRLGGRADIAAISIRVRKAALRRIDAAFFAALRPAMRLDLLTALVNGCVLPNAVRPTLLIELIRQTHAADYRRCVRDMQVDSVTAIAYIGTVRSALLGASATATSTTATPPAAKRAKVVTGPPADVATSPRTAIAQLSAVLELVEVAELDGPVQILDALFDVLAALVQVGTSGTAIDTSYPCQLVMTAMSGLLGRLGAGDLSSDLKIAPVIDTIRRACGPHSTGLMCQSCRIRRRRIRRCCSFRSSPRSCRSK